MHGGQSDPTQEKFSRGAAGAVPTNVFAHKDAASALYAVQEYAEAIVQTMPDALLVLDTELRVKFANDAFYAMFQVQPAQTVDTLVYHLGNGQWNIPELRRLLEDILPENKVFTGYTLTHEFEQTGRRVMLLNGRRLDHAQLILLIIADISEVKQAEVALRAAEEQRRLLLESVSDYAIFTLDPTGCVTSWNEGARRLTGYAEEEIIGQSLRRFYLPEDVAAGLPDYELETALATGRAENESWQVHKDGTRFWVNEIVTPLRAEDGTHVGFAKVSRDLSEQRRAKEALQAGEERLRLILDSINDYAILTMDEDGCIVDWNNGAQEVFGYSSEEARGQPSAMIFTPEDRARNAPAQEIEQARMTGRAADERWHLRKDGTRFFASGVLTPLRTSTRSGFVKVTRDLTERKQMEQRLEAQVRERTAQVRQLVTRLTMTEQEERRRISGILHDHLQQRLFSLMFQLAALRQALAGGQLKAGEQLIGEIEGALRESIQITRELSVDLSPPVLHDEGLAAAVQWLATQMHQQQGLEVQVEAESGLPQLNEDLRVLLFHAVRELLFNIVKHARVSRARVTVTRAGEQVHVEVSDNGQGFALAKPNKATSQGLRRIEQRMQLLGGGVNIVSAPGQGTRVTLSVPLRVQGGEQV